MTNLKFFTSSSIVKQNGKRYQTDSESYSTNDSPDHCLSPVHGSLARAGKVKSQTPKVDKQEKKKTPKGRAKKRILYNRRWVSLHSFCELGSMGVPATVS